MSLKIGMVTTWNQTCGIASYAKFLAQGLIHNRYEVKVLAKTAPHVKEIVEKDEEFVKRVDKLEPSEKFLDDCDVIHIQYQNFLFGNVAGWLKERAKPIIVTLHDSCLRPEDLYCHAVVTHNKGFSDWIFGQKMLELNIQPGIPIIEEAPPESIKNRVISFGLGRNIDDIVEKAISNFNKKHNKNISYTKTYGHRQWLPFDELADLLKRSLCIVLFYPPTDAIVSSLSARVAIGTRRPVIVSDTKWFENISEYIAFKANEASFGNVLENVLLNYSDPKTVDKDWKSKVNQYIHDNHWYNIAERHAAVYNRIRQRFRGEE